MRNRSKAKFERIHFFAEVIKDFLFYFFLKKGFWKSIIHK